MQQIFRGFSYSSANKDNGMMDLDALLSFPMATQHTLGLGVMQRQCFKKTLSFWFTIFFWTGMLSKACVSWLEQTLYVSHDR